MVKRVGLSGCVIRWETEPNYLRFSPLLYRVGAWVHPFIPPWFQSTLVVLGRK